MTSPRNLAALCATVLLLIATSTNAQLYPDLEGPELLEQLVESYKPAQVLSYGEARDSMYGRIYLEGDSVRCVYSGHAVFLAPGVDPSIALYQDGNADGINTEHTWPQSLGASNGQPKSDLHHLFPSRVGVNAARDNFPFSEIPDAQTTQWYYRDQVLSGMPAGTGIDRYSERINGKFEPREDHKGNVARAMFYFNTMYQDQISDPNFFATQRETLCAWHYDDPADSLEMARSWMIAGYQDGKPNPFVLDCSLATRTYCQDIQGECMFVVQTGQTIRARLQITPNPAVDSFVIQNPGESRDGWLKIVAMTGQPILKLPYVPSIPVDIRTLSPGLYIVLLSIEEGEFAGKLIVL